MQTPGVVPGATGLGEAQQAVVSVLSRTDISELARSVRERKPDAAVAVELI